MEELGSSSSSATPSNNTQQQRPQQPPHNPYQQTGSLPPNHFIHKARRVVYIILSGWGLHYFKFYQTLLKSPRIRHEWFQLGLASSVAILMIKSYVETYDGKIKKKEINYENYKQTTHAVIGLILFSTVAFNCALWPHYGWNSPILLGLCFFGMILQFLLIVPTYVQNLVGIALFTFFLQEYSSGTSMIYY
ncbi:hypothetical protein ACA910_021914 [Epithemia clementina (nom. ined.)]